MLSGTEVTVVRLVESGSDGFNMPVYEEETETVSGCLVCPASTESLGETRPEGFVVEYTVIFPQTFTGDLANAQLVIPLVSDTERFDVAGDPRAVPHNCPTSWNRVAVVGRVAG